MKYYHHCGKPVTEKMCFCAECGTELLVEKEKPVATQETVSSKSPKTENAEQVQEKEKVTELEMEQIFAKWQMDSPKNKFITEKLSRIYSLIETISIVISVILLIALILSCRKIINNEALSDIIIKARVAAKMKRFLKVMVIFCFSEKILTGIPNPCSYVRLSVADFIKKENLNRRELIKGVTQGKITAEEYTKLSTNIMHFCNLFADSIFIASSDNERSNFVRDNLISIVLRLVGMITLAMGLLELLPFIDRISFGGFSGTEFISAIVKQPLFYISIGCIIGYLLFCSKMKKDRNKRKMEWLKKEASDLFSDLKIAGKK